MKTGLHIQILRDRGRSRVQTPAGSSLLRDFSAFGCPHYVDALMYSACQKSSDIHWRFRLFRFMDMEYSGVRKLAKRVLAQVVTNLQWAGVDGA